MLAMVTVVMAACASPRLGAESQPIEPLTAGRVVVLQKPRALFFQEYFSAHWGTLKQQLVSMASAEDLSRLYDLQASSNLLLDWAIDHGREDVLQELLEIYALPLKRLEQYQEYAFQAGVDGATAGYAVVKTARPYIAWLNPLSDGRREEPLFNIAQFLYAVTRGLNGLDKPTKILNDYGYVLRDHYTRWILGIEEDRTKGAFQRRGWGCGNGRFNENHVVDLLLRKAFPAKPLDCNVVTDSELWMIAGAAELLALDARFHVQVGLTDSERKALGDFARAGSDLLRSRLTRTSVNVDGVPGIGLLFDAGPWKGHVDMKYAGVEADTFPTPEQAVSSPVPEDIAMDVSHARRLVHVFETLYRSRRLIGSDFPSETDMARLANQLAYGVFDENYRTPRFKNYISGANGWFRVGYSGRTGFGYHPYAMSNEWIGSGYCRLERFQPRLRKICDAILGIFVAREDELVNHREQVLRMCYYSNFVKQQCGELDYSKASFYVMNFLTALLD